MPNRRGFGINGRSKFLGKLNKQGMSKFRRESEFLGREEANKQNKIKNEKLVSIPSLIWHLRA